MRVRLLVPALLLASAALAPARPAAADDGAQIRRNYTAPIAGTPLPMWQWPEEKAPKKAKSPALVILGGIFGGLGAAGAVTGLVLTATDDGTQTTRHEVGLTTLLASSAVAAAGLTMVLVGVQPAEGDDAAATTGARLVPSVAIGPTGGVLTWRF
jgi:hypothetical protein